VLKISLRTKFLLSLAVISASLTWATLLLVRQRVQVHVREQIADSLHNSVVTFQSLQQQREATLSRSAALLAALPPLKAVMTSRDTVTIQDASATFWKLIGSDLFVLSDSSGRLMALHTSRPGFTDAEAQQSLQRSIASGEAKDWWHVGGRLFQVFLQPIYFGSADENVPIGLLAVGYEIDDRVASDISRVSASQVAFGYGNSLVVSTVQAQQRDELVRAIGRLTAQGGGTRQLQLGNERFLATSVVMSPGDSDRVTLTVLKSYDQATAFLESLNRWIVVVGLAAVLAGSILVFLVSTTFTRPLAELVAGVQALERGDYAFPLQVRGSDEVSSLTVAFHRMRLQLQETQSQLLDAERLATIGRMASTISHDLRHPLTAVLAYAEFLSDGNLSEHQRKDFFQEIRIAVNRMTDEISSLLGFSKHREILRPVYGRLSEILERAVQNVKILPEFESVKITFADPDECSGWFDPAKVERVLLNLLFNACEAVCPESGQVEIVARASAGGMVIQVVDNGPGIPDAIRDSLFQPFVSHGKEKGIGLGLTVVQKIMTDHGGKVSIVTTGPRGTTFELTFPSGALNDKAASSRGTSQILS
jgi:signal transduction histidine kinase